jgi:hypothetical protein
VWDVLGRIAADGSGDVDWSMDTNTTTVENK